MSFRKWLTEQQNRKDAIGALARATVGQTEKLSLSKRQKNEHKRWASFLTRRGMRQHIRAFNKAWPEYEQAQSATAAD